MRTLLREAALSSASMMLPSAPYNVTRRLPGAGASSTLTLGYTSRLRTSLTQAQPTIGNWTHAYTWASARRLDTLTGSSGVSVTGSTHCRKAS